MLYPYIFHLKSASTFSIIQLHLDMLGNITVAII